MSQKIRIISSKGTRSYIVYNSSNNLSWNGEQNSEKTISKKSSGQGFTITRETSNFWLKNTQKLDVCANPKKITLLMEKGTKKIIHILNPFSRSGNVPKIQSEKKLICNTCKKEVTSDICRTLVMNDKNKSPNFMSFHFFSPCWDPQKVFQKFQNMDLQSAGFFIPESVKMSEKAICKLRTDSSLWS